MKAKIASPQNLMTTIVIVLAFFISSNPSWAKNQTPAVPLAVVEGVQGTVDMTTAGALQSVKLVYGDILNSWDTITTNAHSKLYLRWDSGVLTSEGESSSVSLVQNEPGNGPLNVLRLTKGFLRITKRSGGGNVSPYLVSTPTVSVEPADYGAPVDFIVDVRSPGATKVTVIAGPVRVYGLSGTRSTELTIPDCHTALISQGRHLPKVVGTDTAYLDKLVKRTTIPGTIVTDFACPVRTWLF